MRLLKVWLGSVREERAEEQKLIRRLQMMMNMVMQVIAQDASLSWTMLRR